MASAKAALWQEERWRLRKEELDACIRAYKETLMEDVKPLLNPTHLERYLLSDEVRLERLKKINKSDDANRDLLNTFRSDLDHGFDKELRTLVEPSHARRELPRPVARVRDHSDARYLPRSSSGGAIESLLLHLQLDWSDGASERVSRHVLKALEAQGLPRGSSLLLPGCGLCRVALELAAAGYQVEANDASRLLVTAADWLLNRTPSHGIPFFPLAHLFGHDSQYGQARCPASTPASLVSEVVRHGSPAITLVPGEFRSLYGPGGPANRQFQVLVTSFFMDALWDLAEFVVCVESLLPVGGVWVNVRPLHARSRAKLKLSWEEITSLFRQAGFEFKSSDWRSCDARLVQGAGAEAETCPCVVSVAVKGGQACRVRRPNPLDTCKKAGQEVGSLPDTPGTRTPGEESKAASTVEGTEASTASTPQPLSTGLFSQWNFKSRRWSDDSTEDESDAAFFVAPMSVPPSEPAREGDAAEQADEPKSAGEWAPARGKRRGRRTPQARGSHR